ncbi:MAG: glycosyltransferase family 2 protein [Candidatus Omnitrophica bacterium]|nr:glycosyltransferase family 2 protein [Candidatus Omnitrophota bacterium]
MKIGVLIPAHNEAEHIGSLLKAVRDLGMDILVIDDGSTDHTSAVALQNGAKLIRNEQKRGKGYSLRRGFAQMLSEGYDGIVTMDGDGQHDPADLQKFIDAAREHPTSVIIGNRMGRARGMPLIRYLTNRIMSSLISLFCRINIPDTQCGYRYIPSAVLRAIHLTSGDFEIETEILMRAAKQGFAIFSVPVKTIYRDEESKIHPGKDTLRFLIYFIREVSHREKFSNRGKHD